MWRRLPLYFVLGHKAGNSIEELGCAHPHTTLWCIQKGTDWPHKGFNGFTVGWPVKYKEKIPERYHTLAAAGLDCGGLYFKHVGVKLYTVRNIYTLPSMMRTPELEWSKVTLHELLAVQACFASLLKTLLQYQFFADRE